MYSKSTHMEMCVDSQVPFCTCECERGNGRTTSLCAYASFAHEPPGLLTNTQLSLWHLLVLAQADGGAVRDEGVL